MIKSLTWIWPLMILVRKIINILIRNFGDDAAKERREFEERPNKPDKPK